MKEVFKLIRVRSTELSKNQLFAGWLADETLAPDERLTFMPMMLDFVMGFRDFNRHYVRYPRPQNALQRALNEHASEDETHSRLLLEDWRSLRMDERLGWAPRDLYWWMTDEATSDSRRLDFELMRMTWENPDPMLRFAIVESMEAAGTVFFRRTAPLADGWAARTGRPLPYFGTYHLERETGHLQNGDERPFFREVMSAAQRQAAMTLVDRVFSIFEAHFTSWATYARAVHQGRWTFAARRLGREGANMRSDSPRDLTAWTHLDHPGDVTGEGRELAQARHSAYADLWDSPGYRWVRSAFPGEFKTMVRYFLLQWVVDNWACADYFRFDTAYFAPASPIERGINRLGVLFASEMKRRYVEWETLGLDAFTGFSVTEALTHYWLDEMVEGHRAAFADLRKLTFRFPKPLHRYWIMKCFVRFGDTLMHSLGAAMRTAREPDEAFITFAGYPERLHPDLPEDRDADRAIECAERAPLADEDVAALRQIVAETREQEARRADLTWRVVEARRYHAMHERWLNRVPGGHDAPAFHTLSHKSERTCEAGIEK